MQDEYDLLSDIREKFELELLNRPDLTTWRRVVALELQESVLDLTFASTLLTRVGFSWELQDFNGSDHSAILASFNLPSQRPPAPRDVFPGPPHPDPNATKWRFGNPINEQKYVQTVSQKVRTLLARVHPGPSNQEIIDCSKSWWKFDDDCSIG